MVTVNGETISVTVDQEGLDIRVQSDDGVNVYVPMGMPGTPGNVAAYLDALPDYLSDEDAAADNYEGKYYWIAEGSDIGPAGFLKKRLDI